MRHATFRKTRLATSLTLALGTTAMAPVLAQDAQDAQAQQEIEVIEVTGIRGSLIKSKDIKRESDGVVDAISAEDIGKFPDTNLAESLQRITGVSIDRQRGEGSKVTVRGFGPDYNLVTLNGRQMPTANIEDTTASGSRSFDFANLASESVSSVEVYKTARANLPSGGIGSTINIVTARPLAKPGLNASVGIKAVHDTSTKKGDKVTPEISGILSNTFADDTFGVSLTGSYQKRHGGYNDASVGNGWRGQVSGAEGWGGLPPPADNDLIVNRPVDGVTYAVPQNLVYGFNEFQRERINGQLTMQWRPIERLTATLDYTYARNTVSTQHNDFSVWMNYGHTASVWTDAKPGEVAAPLIISESNWGGAFDNDGNPTGFADVSMGAARYATKAENKSIGINLDYDITDNLNLFFDYHQSSAEMKPNSPFGNSSTLSSASFTRASTTLDFRSDFPVMTIGYPNSVGGTISGIDASTMQSTGSSFRNSYQRSEIDQGALGGTYVFDTGIVESIDFGVNHSKMSNRSAFANFQRDTWGGPGHPDDYPDSIWSDHLDTIPNKFDQFGASASPDLEQVYYNFDFDALAKIVGELYWDPSWPCPEGTLCAPKDYTDDRLVEETITAAYLQGHMQFDIGDMPVNVYAGLRYEKTEINSPAKTQVPTNVTWISANEFRIDRAGEAITNFEGEYTNILPNLDLNIELVDDVLARASFSTTIARPLYSDIKGGQSLDEVRIDNARGSRGNPDLDPIKANNYDLSLEWYYDEASYVAIGGFYKDVKQFVGTGFVNESPYSITHPSQGQRYADAVAALGGETDSLLVREEIIRQNPGDPTIVGTDPRTAEISGNGTDPVLDVRFSLPLNSENAKLKGFEFAVQHVFGESGFGGIINYTKVSGDIGYDNTKVDEAQFALLGLSDTANLVAFYDKDGIQVRFAYNWRDKFLSSTWDGSGPNPQYTDAYGQLDVNASYDFSKNLTVFIEGINVTNETRRVHGRHEKMTIYAVQSGPRYAAGVRYKF